MWEGVAVAAKDDLGRAGEERAVAYVEALGWEVLARNWRCRIGELDIVALDGGCVVAIGVKTRAGTGYGHPFEAVTEQKLARLQQLARAWRAEHGAQYRRIRVDAIALIGPDPSTALLEHLPDLRSIR